MKPTRKKRIKINTDVTINHTDKGEALDLSSDGMYIYTRHTFIVGASVEIRFELEGEAYELSARIRHAQEGVGFGVSFTDLDVDSSTKLKAYVASHSDS